MSPKEEYLERVIKSSNQFIMPVFQRFYVWNQKMWSTLWKDINILIEEEDIKLKHFMGPMIFSDNTSLAFGSKTMVIDGQQRLITIFILLAVIRDHAKKMNLKGKSESIDSKYLFSINAENEMIPKIEPRMRDRDAFLKIINNNHEDIDTESLVIKAYQFFSHKIEEILPSQGDLFKSSTPQIFIEKLINTITMRLCVLAIELSPDDSPASIYYSINFKSEPLSDADLIRNYVFMQFKTFEEQEQFNTTTWGDFEELFGVTEQSRESKKSTKEKEDLSDFYYRYLLSKQGYFPYKKVYSQFISYANEFVRTRNRSFPKLVNELKQYANYSISILSECKEPDLETAFKRFRLLEREKTTIPLLLYLYNKYEENKSFKPTFLEMLRIIESFILRRAILKRRTLRGYGEISTKAIDYADNPIRLMQFLIDKDWPDDLEVRKALKDYPYYHESPEQTKLILSEIERSYGHKEIVNLEDPRITIEHVMPQTLNESWQQMLGKDFNKIHKKYLHTLGNLTLTGYNGEMGNRPYKKKRQELINSHLELNTYFKNHERWTEKEILERSDVLIDKFIKIWKRPTL